MIDFGILKNFLNRLKTTASQYETGSDDHKTITDFVTDFTSLINYSHSNSPITISLLTHCQFIVTQAALLIQDDVLTTKVKETLLALTNSRNTAVNTMFNKFIQCLSQNNTSVHNVELSEHDEIHKISTAIFGNQFDNVTKDLANFKQFCQGLVNAELISKVKLQMKLITIKKQCANPIASQIQQIFKIHSPIRHLAGDFEIELQKMGLSVPTTPRDNSEHDLPAASKSLPNYSFNQYRTAQRLRSMSHKTDTAISIPEASPTTQNKCNRLF